MENNFNDEQKKVFSVFLKIEEAFKNRDIDGLLSAYEENAVVVLEPQKPLSGKEELRKGLTQFLAMNAQISSPSDKHEIYISGDIATHIATWSMTGLLPDGTKIEQSGLGIEVLKKQTNGNWLIIQDNSHVQFLISK